MDFPANTFSASMSCLLRNNITDIVRNHLQGGGWGGGGGVDTQQGISWTAFNEGSSTTKPNRPVFYCDSHPVGRTLVSVRGSQFCKSCSLPAHWVQMALTRVNATITQDRQKKHPFESGSVRKPPTHQPEDDSAWQHKTTTTDGERRKKKSRRKQ